ncbi:hypothetical protein KIW84_013977 [Lathyrus oleraceus]|uniref:Uncharacterized protein n=1 Tax=Pisum sativum TaxID=3888 RepID=A0A9D5BLM2_PEA|nr:hypothetical protein KIW84_013977 [Pisum sativum]
MHHRAVVVAAETGEALGGMVRQLSIDQFESEGRRIGRKRKQTVSSSGPANSSGTANTTGPSPSSAPSTPSTHTPGDAMSMPALPHNGNSLKPLMMFDIATPEWLTVAKDAAIRRASINYPPMVSHFQLLYDLGLAMCSRIPEDISVRPRSSRLKDKKKGVGQTDEQNRIAGNDVPIESSEQQAQIADQSYMEASNTEKGNTTFALLAIAYGNLSGSEEDDQSDSDIAVDGDDLNTINHPLESKSQESPCLPSQFQGCRAAIPPVPVEVRT